MRFAVDIYIVAKNQLIYKVKLLQVFFCLLMEKTYIGAFGPQGALVLAHKCASTLI